MHQQKFSEEYIKHLFEQRMNSRKELGYLLRSVFVGFIALVVPMLFVANLPDNFITFRWAFIALMIIGFLGLLCEMIQQWLTNKSIIDQLRQMEEYIFETKESDFTFQELISINSRFFVFNPALFWIRVGLASLGCLIFMVCLIIWASRI